MAADGGCPSRETLASFLLGKLAPEREEMVALHLEACAACEAKVQQLEQETDPLIDALRQPRGAPRHPGAVATLAAPASPVPPPQPAPFNLEGYQILGEVGRGGMGVVYRAYQHRLGRLVAIKMILAGQLAGAEDRVRFLMEGALLARLSHPNFVQVHEVGTLEHAPAVVQPYLVLEYVEGSTLNVLMAGPPLAFREAARLALVLARAMEVAHAQGIIHRDLKPANVLIARDGTLKITDFGLAKELGAGTTLTPAGLTVGTPQYMAPEQARGGTAVGPAADVYALGAILYEMLAGRPPFEGATPMEVTLKVLQQAPAPIVRLRPGVPRDLETICLKCLNKEPPGRYARAADLADDLQRWLEHRPIRARPAGRIERASKWVRRHPLPAALLLFLAVSLVTGSAASTYFAVAAGNRADETQKALERAEQATEAERWERYLAEIAAASNALQLNNSGPARRALEAAPASYRNWEWHHFQSQLDGARAVLRGHEEGVSLVTFSAAGKKLASVSEHSLRLWDVASGTEFAVRRPPSGHFRDVAVSPDGSRLVTGGDRVRLWDAATGDLLWEAAVEEAGTICPDWSPDGRYLAGCSHDGMVRVRDAATGREVFAAPCFPTRPGAIFSPDSRHLAVRQGSSTVQVWEVVAGKEEAVLRGHKAEIAPIVYSPDGRRIATGSIFPEDEVRVWDAATGELLGTGKGHANEVSTIAYSPDGRRIATGSMDQTVRLWDGATAQPLATPLKGHTSFVHAVTFSPDGASLLSASADQTLRLWDPAAGRLIAVLRGHTGGVRGARYGPGGLIASASEDQTVRLWDAEILARNGVLRGHTQFVYDVAFRPDGREVASAAWDGTVRLWDPTTGRPTAEPLTHDTTILSGLAYSPNGRKLAVTVREEGVWLWDLAGRKGAHLWEGFAGTWEGDTRPAFHPQGTLLAWGSLEGPVRLWDLERGEEAALLTGHEGGSRDVAFRPDGKQLASAGKDGSVRLWDVATRRLGAVLRGSPETYRLVYSADGRLLAAGSGDKTVRVWAVDTRQPLGVVPLGSAVYGLAFSPDGTRLACACADNTIRLLDVARLREVAELRGHEAYVHAVQFSPDGTRLVSASGDFTVRIWDTLSAQDRAH